MNKVIIALAISLVNIFALTTQAALAQDDVFSQEDLFSQEILAAEESPTPTATATPTPESLTLTTEGISGEADKGRRSPVLSASTSVGTGNVKILVDAYVPSPQYQKFPIKFEIFVNRKLIVTQIRSTELPGPIGIDVGSNIATPPFNYSIVATLLHPNRQYTTVLNAAVE